MNTQNTMENNSLTPSTNIKDNGSKVKLSEFLNRHYIKKDDSTAQSKPMTNTRIGDKSLGITGGSYYISDEEYGSFMKLILYEIIEKNEKEYLTEKQLETEGPILVDIDFL